MDYLNPHKQLQQRIILLIGYVLVAVAIIIATTILLYQAYGFGLGKNGTVIQNGLVFLSSQPNPAQIYINGSARNNATTNTRLLLPAGAYSVTLSRQGYNDWKRKIDVFGGTVMHFDYPFLFPKKLVTTKLQTYTSAPGFATQSPDRRWLLVETPGSDTTFDLYDLKKPNTKPTDITIPSGVVSKAAANESWQLDQWADDNQHVVLQHNFDGKTEFVLVDCQNPDQSLNLNTSLGVNPSKLTLNNVKYNQYYLYDAGTDSLETASLGTPAAVPLLTHVLEYQTYGNNSVLYATDSDAPAGKILVKLAVGAHTYIIHSFPAGSNYLLDLTEYSGTLYVAAGASSVNKVYIFRDPIAQLNANPAHAVVPIQVLHVTAPNYLSFSDNAQFIVAEDGSQFGVYDIENKVGYNYSSALSLDAPQIHATWMDGDRLTFVSGGKLVVFDYDHTNQQILMSQSPAYLPFFSSDYKYVYGLAPNAVNGQLDVTQTSLLTPADQ